MWQNRDKKLDLMHGKIVHRLLNSLLSQETTTMEMRFVILLGF